MFVDQFMNSQYVLMHVEINQVAAQRSHNINVSRNMFSPYGAENGQVI